jgi:hypothetical protein
MGPNRRGSATFSSGAAGSFAEPQLLAEKRLGAVGGCGEGGGEGRAGRGGGRPDAEGADSHRSSLDGSERRTESEEDEEATGRAAAEDETRGKSVEGWWACDALALEEEPLRRNVSQPGSSLLDEAELLAAERSSRSLRDRPQDELDEPSSGGRLAAGGGEATWRAEDDVAYGGGRPDDDRMVLVEAAGYDRELW